jgi:anti-sigma factor RsiW
MSHLGEQISALADGELTGAELDRANAHLAACGRCRDEAAAVRQLKRALRALAESLDTADDVAGQASGPGSGSGQAGEALTQRLLAMAGPGGPVPSRKERRAQFRSSKREQRTGQPHDGRPPGAPRRRRGRYMIFSAVTIVFVGIGTAAFSMGGGNGAGPGPNITPQLEMFSVEHAITSGDVPFPDPTQAPTARP